MRLATPIVLDKDESEASITDRCAVDCGFIKGLLECTLIPTLVVDADLRVLAFTSTAAELCRLAPGDEGVSLAGIRPGLSYDKLEEDAGTALRSGSSTVREAVAPDGKLYQIRIVPHPSRQAGALGLVITFFDITASKKGEQESRRLATIVRDSNDSIIVVGLDGRILSWNHGAEKVYGYTEAEALSMNMLELVPEDQRENAIDLIDRLARGQTIASSEGQRVTKDGRTLDVWLTCTALTDTAGRPEAIALTCRDITDRKRAAEQLRASFAELGVQYEQRGSQLAATIEKLNTELAARARIEKALRESQDRLSVVFQTAAEGIITIDHRGIIESFNPASERIFGWPAQEVVGKNISLLMPSPSRAEHDKHIARYLATGEKRVIGISRELVGQRKDGKLFPMEITVGEGVDGASPVFTGIVRDLTARKESEHQLRSAERLAAVGALAAGLGHDMNHVLLPVRARLNALHAAAKAGAIRPAERKHTEAIAKSIAYLQQLADGLHFLVMDPEDGDRAEGHTNLHNWWRQSWALLSKPVPRHVRVVASIPARASRTGGRRGLPEVAIAPHRLTQIVLNLIVNAGQAIPPPEARAGREGRIRIYAEAVGAGAGHHDCRTVRLCVEDNGMGMTDEVKRHAFDMFFTTKPRGMGTGLGLPLVARLVRNVGGRVKIESKAGKGTTVVLELPAITPSLSCKSGDGVRSATISIDDQRASSLARQLLQAGGVCTRPGDNPAGSNIWIVRPSCVGIARASAWVKGGDNRRAGGALRRRNKLVVLGPLSAGEHKAWSRLSPLLIERPDDFVAIRDAIGRAVHGIDRSERRKVTT